MQVPREWGVSVWTAQDRTRWNKSSLTEVAKSGV